jgi:Cytochrome c7 and related cytochrome c/Class III cytochrome C family
LKPSTAKALLPIILVLFVGLGGWAFIDTFSNVGYAPKQPIPFNHKTHAGINRIPCLYCHGNAERSRHATVPAMNICMNCHSVVATDKPDVQTLTSLWNNNTTLQWVRIYRLPDYVYFSHRWHVAKAITCQECHGLVDSMDVIQQVPNLKMGWCISCHRKNEASIECNTCHM